MGSSVVSGTARALWTRPGRELRSGRSPRGPRAPRQTEFERGICAFGVFILKTVLFLVLCSSSSRRSCTATRSSRLLFAVALAVGLTPEFLPMITTVTLARGAVRMARSQGRSSSTSPPSRTSAASTSSAATRPAR